jgi:hypothetical protein
LAHPTRLAIFDLCLSEVEMAAISSLNRDKRRGLDPDDVAF